MQSGLLKRDLNVSALESGDQQVCHGSSAATQNDNFYRRVGMTWWIGAGIVGAGPCHLVKRVEFLYSDDGTPVHES